MEHNKWWMKYNGWWFVSVIIILICGLSMTLSFAEGYYLIAFIAFLVMMIAAGLDVDLEKPVQKTLEEFETKI